MVCNYSSHVKTIQQFLERRPRKPEIALYRLDGI